MEICRDDFGFETANEDVIFGPKPNVLANLRMFTASYSNLKKKAIDSLAGAGYSRELVEKTLADLQTEFATMSDLDFNMQMLKSDGPALPAETDLKKALRAMYLQCSFDIEYAFTTKINTMNTLIIKSNIEAGRERYPFFYHVSMMDEKGHEVHWINYRLKEKMEPQAFADRLATLMVDKKKMVAK